MTRVADEEGRQRIRAALDETLIVEAAAGTGKTSELVRRIVNLVAEGRAAIDRIVAVTFTEKAAGELKLRLRVELEAARAANAGDERRRSHLEQALAHLEEARVSTIHGFCADLLRERPVEARVDPRFQVLPEPEAERIYRQAFDLWLQQKLEDPPEGVRRSLRRVSRFDDDEGPVARLRRAGWELAAWRDFPAPWRRDSSWARNNEMDLLVNQVHDFADMTRTCTNPKDTFYHDTWKGRQVSDTVRNAERVRSRDYDGIEARLVELAQDRGFAKPRQGYDSNWRGTARRKDTLAAHAPLTGALASFARAADADLAALLHEELRESIDRYEQLKERLGRLDFVDLLVRARDLVRDHDHVRAEFQRRFTHILVDEFQDTDPLQAEILLLLSADEPRVRSWREARPAPGKLFIVGDPKQSIYRFRRADVGTYQQVRDLLVSRGAGLVYLKTSFRAVPSIQNLVNAAFAPQMKGDLRTLQADYIDLLPNRTDPTDQPAVIALPVPFPYGSRGVTFTAIEKSLPDAVGALVAWLISDSGWKVTERFAATGGHGNGRESRVPLAARHICILFRRFEKFGSDITRDYVQALEARGIPHLLVGGRSFHQREEVEAMRAALSAIEWPDDELSVFATLRGSLFAVPDAALLEYRHRFGRLHPFRISKGEMAEQLQLIPPVLDLLGALHRSRNYIPVAETVARLLVATRAYAGFALRPSGEQALANVLHIAEMARRYEESGGISFRGFIERLREDAGNGVAGEAPILEEGSDGVRIMTVHRAKGLEFPVVVLADSTATLAHNRAARHIDPERKLCSLRIAGWSPADLLEQEDLEIERDRAEGIRLAYVAATRARDLLVVPGLGDGPHQGSYEERWLSALDAAIYPPAERRRSPERPTGCPEFGDDSVLERRGAELPGPGNVQPGLHRFGAGNERGYGVVWWDPGRLSLGAAPPFGLRQTELISKDAPRTVVEADLEAHRQWRQDHDTAVARGSQPSLRVRTATEWAAMSERPEETARDVQVLDLSRGVRRPAGPRFGSLVHAVLASVPLDAGPDRILATTRLQARILGATEEEAQAAFSAVSDALRHSLLERAREAGRLGRCRRETPVTLREDDGALVEGVIDLAFEESGRWIVVDFKTDRELARGIKVYQRQVTLYAEAIARATGLPASAVLLRL